jgi:hypothetical protein
MRIPIQELNSYLSSKEVEEATYNLVTHGSVVQHDITDCELPMNIVPFVGVTDEVLWDVYNGDACISGLGGVQGTQVEEYIREYLSHA